MAEYNSLILTHNGETLLTQMLGSNNSLSLSEIRLSQDIYTQAQVLNVVNLQDIQSIVPSSSVEFNEVTGTFTVSAKFHNMDIEEAFSINSIGLYANIDGVIQLMGIATAIDPIQVKPYQQTPNFYHIKLSLALTESQNNLIKIVDGNFASLQDIYQLDAKKQNTLTAGRNIQITPEGVIETTFDNLNSEELRGPQGPQGKQGIQGPQGEKGEQGEKGSDGTSINIVGALVSPNDLPPATFLNRGDAYIIEGDLYVSIGTSWQNTGRIQGPQGPKGDTGPQGPQGPKGPQGDPGDSGVEVEQARVDASGHTNETLKERLDKEHNEVTAQLAQKAQQVEQLERSKADKSDLKAILEPTEKDNKEYVLESGRYGSRGESHRDKAFVRYAEFFGGYGVNGVIRNTNPIEYSFDVIFYDQEKNYIERDRGLTNTEYVVDEKYLFRVAISRTDGASIVESDIPAIHDAFFISDRLHITGNISGNIMLDKHSVKLENLADKQRIIYPFPRDSLLIEQVEGDAVYFYVNRIMVRNHSGNVFFYYRDYSKLLSEYVADSPSGGRNYIRIPEKKSLVYDVPEKTLKIVEWQEIETTQDLLLLSNHDDLKGVLADYWKWSILEDVSTKVESLTTSDSFVNIPKYWNEHINEKVNRIRSNQMALGKDGFSFGFITDIHYNPRRTDYKVSSPYIMSKVMKDCSIKFFINGGDIGNQQNGENGRKIIISDYYELLGKFKDAGIIDKMLPLLGNHESNTQNWPSGSGDFDNVMVNNDEIYSIYFRDTERIHGISYGGDGTYYYVDDTPNQVRYICLNTNDVEYRESRKIDYAIKQQQFDWLISEALELPNADWSVILASHIPPVTEDFDHRGMPVKNMELLKGIVKAFKNKSTFSNSESHSNTSYNASVNVDFTSNENDFIVWISGHHHRDYVTLVDNSYTVVITPDDGRRNYDNPIKTIGTDTEHVMDFFTVDKINKKVLITRVGAGEDREFTY